MAFSGDRVVFLCCFFVHFAVKADFFLFQGSGNGLLAFVTLVQGVTLLLYPVLGLLADVYFTRYIFIKASIILLFVSSLLLLVGIAILLIIVDAGFVSIKGVVAPIPWYVLVIAAGLIIVIILSVGMFEATAIQFGMDQMLEASSDQLSAFVHWYYWSMNIGIGIMALLSFTVAFILGQCILHVQEDYKIYMSDTLLLLYILLPALILQVVFSLLAFLCFYRHKENLTIAPAGYNPFTTVYKVLRYAWSHKCPENRSAFTYWEEDIPPCIDLGKNKYGGPFTTEEVEDVKTFFLLFVLLLTLFGFQLADDGYSVMRQLSYKLCPSAEIFIITVLSPSILSTVTVLVCVPLLHYILLPFFNRYVPNMLHRLGIGSALIFFQELAKMVIVLSSWVDYITCPQVQGSLWFACPISDCYMSRVYILFRNSCTTLQNFEHCGEGDGLFLWLLIPTVTYSFAYHLVFMTALEFISAQAPLQMKGLLVSLWYAMSAQQYIMQGVAVLNISQDEDWLIFHGVMASFILLSLMLYCCVAKHYRYRLRDEVVNEQYLVEEIYDRELRMAEANETEESNEERVIVHSISNSDYESTSESSSSTVT